MCTGLRGILGGLLDITPDYRKTREEVFEDATIHIMEKMGSVNILQYAASGDASLPSWTVDLQTPSQERFYSLRRNCIWT